MKKSRMFFGVLFIIVAIMMIVTQLGIIDIQISVISLLLTVFFGVTAVWSLFHKRPTGFLLSLAFLAIIYDKPLGIEAITPWTVLLAAILASIGCHILFQPKKQKKEYKYNNIETLQENDIFLETNFGSSIKYVDSKNIQSVCISNVAGMMKVYFDNADMKEFDAIIDIHMWCGMLELYIPKTWKVIDHTDNLFSHIAMEEQKEDLITHQIRLTGKITFSEIKIIYV